MEPSVTRVVERVTGQSRRASTSDRRSRPTSDVAAPVARAASPDDRRDAGVPDSDHDADYVAIIPMVMRDARRRSPRCSPRPSASRASGCRSAGSALIGLVGAAVASVLLWDTRRHAASASSAPTTSASSSTSMLCVVGLLTMLFSTRWSSASGCRAGEYYALMLFAHQRHDADGDGDRPAGHLPRARDAVARGLRADRHPPRRARRAPRRRSSTSCSARSRARSSSTASRSPTASTGSTRLDRIGSLHGRRRR